MSKKEIELIKNYKGRVTVCPSHEPIRENLVKRSPKLTRYS